MNLKHKDSCPYDGVLRYYARYFEVEPELINATYSDVPSELFNEKRPLTTVLDEQLS